MKVYRVEIADEVFEAIRSQAKYIACDQKSPQNAQQWLEGLWDAIDSLEKWPKRCGFAPENDYRPFEIRQRIYGDSIILFTVDDEQNIVYVIGFRHGGQQSKIVNRLDDTDDSIQ